MTACPSSGIASFPARLSVPFEKLDAVVATQFFRNQRSNNFFDRIKDAFHDDAVSNRFSHSNRFSDGLVQLFQSAFLQSRNRYERQSERARQTGDVQLITPSSRRCPSCSERQQSADAIPSIGWSGKDSAPSWRRRRY